MSNLLEINNLVVRYDLGQPVLKGVCLHSGPAERIAILGPSGAGKTTLFRAINGFIPAVSGSIRVEQTEVTQLRGAALRRLRSRIAVVSQRHDLVDELRVYQNVMAGALGRWSSLHALRFLLWPLKGELAQAEAALGRVGLSHKVRVRTAELSGGEHQRVAIARALIQEPCLMLADEPVSSLDPALSEQTLELLCSLAAENHVTLLCSLHQPHLAERYFDRILEMRSGEIVEERSGGGKPAFQDPRSSALIGI